MITRCWHRWSNFWFRPEPPIAVALYRIMFGCLVLCFGFLLAPDLSLWFGDRGAVSAQAARRFPQEQLIDVLYLLPPGDENVFLFFKIFMLAALCLTIGFKTRLSAFIVFIGMSSFHHRDWLIMNSGDTFMRLAAIYLAMSNAGRALSLDRMIELWTQSPPPAGPAPASSPWVQRLMQVQLSMLYCQAFLTKMAGAMWLNGSAVYYVTRLEDFQRHPLPFFLDNYFATVLLTYFTLLVEVSMCTLVWFRPLRYPVLLAAIALHLGIDYTMNLPIFEYLMITPYILFVQTEDLERVRQWMIRTLRPFVSPPAILLYDSENERSVRLAETVRRLDPLEGMKIFDIRAHETEDLWSEFAGSLPQNSICLFTADGGRCIWRHGVVAVREALLLSSLSIFGWWLRWCRCRTR